MVMKIVGKGQIILPIVLMNTRTNAAYAFFFGFGYYFPKSVCV